MGNETYQITAKSPLLRPGLEITVIGVSEKYLVPVTASLMGYVREINKQEKERTTGKPSELEAPKP
jgi:cell division protein FtsI/penicillin-binding protein 2